MIRQIDNDEHGVMILDKFMKVIVGGIVTYSHSYIPDGSVPGYII